MSSLIRLSNENLLKRIELVKESINELYIENKIFASDHCKSLYYYNTHMNHYQRELQELEIEKQKRIQQLPVCKRNLSKAVSRNQSQKAVRTLLTSPHYSELPKTMTGRLFSRFVGETGLSRYILNHITGEDILPTKERVYLRELQDKISELPEEIVKKIWDNLSKKSCISNIRENSSSSDEPMPERNNSSGGKRRKTKKYKTRRNKTRRNKTRRNKTRRNKTRRNKKNLKKNILEKINN